MTATIHDSSEIQHGKLNHSSMIQTYTAPRFVELRNKWYPDGVKVVPKDLRLTPLACAHWHVQDGQNRQEKREVALNTNSFTKDEAEFLVDLLQKDVGVRSHPRQKDGQWIIVMGNQFGNEGYFQFFDVVRPFITWQCFQYKCCIDEAINADFSRRNKLDLNKAREIRALYLTNEYTQYELAKMFDCCQPVVSHIVNNLIHKES